MARDRQLAHTAGPGQSTATAAPSWGRRLRAWLGGPGARRDAARALYLALVAQARLPVFYAAWNVPDSRDGRLEMVGLHAILVMRRLRTEGRAGQALAQALFDVMFRDVDHHLREWGVGDLSVGKQVKTLAHNFLGRAETLDPLLDGSDPPRLATVLQRNVYSDGSPPAPESVARLADYLCRQRRWLDDLDGPELLAGQVRFMPPAGADSPAVGQSRVDPSRGRP